jgi:hypothetical protein
MVLAPRILLATIFVALAASSAEGYRVGFATNGNPPPIAPGQLGVVQVVLDTEGQGDIALLGIGVLFDESVLAYRQDLSSSATYLLYTSGKNPYLVPASTCGGGPGSPTAGQGCNLFPTRSNQVQLDFISNRLPAGVPGTGAVTLVTLVFEAIGAGAATVQFDFDPVYGSILQLGDTTNPSLALGPGVTIGLIPEPATAVLVGAGLAALAASARRDVRTRRARDRRLA